MKKNWSGLIYRDNCAAATYSFLVTLAPLITAWGEQCRAYSHKSVLNVLAHRDCLRLSESSQRLHFHPQILRLLLQAAQVIIGFRCQRHIRSILTWNRCLLHRRCWLQPVSLCKKILDYESVSSALRRARYLDLVCTWNMIFDKYIFEANYSKETTKQWWTITLRRRSWQSWGLYRWFRRFRVGGWIVNRVGISSRNNEQNHNEKNSSGISSRRSRNRESESSASIISRLLHDNWMEKSSEEKLPKINSTHRT